MESARGGARTAVGATLERSPSWVRTGVDLTNRTARDTIEDRVPGLAAEAALFTLISLPALILVVLGSLGFVADALGPEGADELDRLVFELPRTFFSERTYEAYADIARTVVEDGRADVVSVGLLLSLWTGSRAVNRILETVSIAYDVTPRPGWRRRLVALGLTVAGLVGAVAVLPMLVLGPRIVRLVAPETVAEASPVKEDMSVWERLPCRRSAAITDRLFFWRTSSVLAIADMGWGMLPERPFSCCADLL